MPQFETAWYLGEIFWMLLTFLFMYLGVKYFIFPLMQEVFSERSYLINNDLNIAEDTNKKAEALIKDYNARIYSVEQTRAELLNYTYQDIQKFSMHIESKQEEFGRKQIQGAEEKLAIMKNEFVKKSDDLALDIAEKLAQKLSNPT